MSTEDNKAVVRRFYETLNRADLAALDDVLAPNYVAYFAGIPTPIDRAAFTQVMGASLMAFPDLHHTVEDLVAEGDKVAPRLTLQGTQQGEFQGLPPTGRQVTFTGINLMRLEDGKIVEHWSNGNTLGMLQQLGAIPAPGQSGG